MKVQDLVKELEDSIDYKTFKSKEVESFFAAGFFILNLKDKSESIQLDFFLPSKNKIAAFEFPFGEPKIFDEEIKQMKFQTTDIKIDIDDLEQVCKRTIKENNSLIVPTKIIAILKDSEWNLTCMDDMLGIVRIKHDAITGKQIDFNKGSLMDFMGIKKKAS